MGANKKEKCYTNQTKGVKGEYNESQEKGIIYKNPKSKRKTRNSMSKPSHQNIFKEKPKKGKKKINKKPDIKSSPIHSAAPVDDTFLFLFTKNNKAKETPLLKPLYVECFHMVFRAISHVSR